MCNPLKPQLNKNSGITYKEKLSRFNKFVFTKEKFPSLFVIFKNTKYNPPILFYLLRYLPLTINLGYGSECLQVFLLIKLVPFVSYHDCYLVKRNDRTRE